MDIPRVEPRVELRLNGFGLGDLFRLEAIALEHVEEVGIAPGVELICPIDPHPSIAEKPDQCPVHDRRTDLALDIVADDRDAGVAKLLRPMRVRGEEHGNAIDHGKPGHRGTPGRNASHRLLRADRQIAQQDLGARGRNAAAISVGSRSTGRNAASSG